MSMFDLDDVPNWRGRDVIDQNGHAVGVITDLYVDEASGRPEWAGVRTALFSHRVTFVPLNKATSHGLRVQVPFDQRQVREAPNFDPDGHLTRSCCPRYWPPRCFMGPQGHQRHLGPRALPGAPSAPWLSWWDEDLRRRRRGHRRR